MTQTLGLLLAEEENICHIGDLSNGLSFLLFAVQQQTGLQIGGIVKIVLDGGFAPIGNDQDLLNAGGYGFLYDIL